MFINGVEIPYIITNAIEITQAEYDQLQDKSGTYIIKDAVSTPLGADEVSYSNQASGLPSTNVQGAIDAMAISHTFTLTTTDWVANTNTRNNDKYTVMQVISTTYYSDTPNTEELPAQLLSADAGEVMTTAEEEDSGKICGFVGINSTSVTVYAEEATTNELRIRIIGV